METSSIIKKFMQTLANFNISFGLHIEKCGSICLIADHDIYATQNNETIKIKLGSSFYEKKVSVYTEKIRTVNQYNQLLCKYLAMHINIKMTKAEKELLPDNYLK